MHIQRLGEDAASFVAHRAGNDAILKELDMPRPKSVTVSGAGGTPVQMWILQPPGFDPKKKWPLVFLVHGGPQGAWEDSWSNRWNPEVWAAQGYVVALPNPRGSTGFGQQFCDEISGDWGGKCYEDLMACLACLEATHRQGRSWQELPSALHDELVQGSYGQVQGQHALWCL